jgi:hypothetical protein
LVNINDAFLGLEVKAGESPFSKYEVYEAGNSNAYNRVNNAGGLFEERDLIIEPVGAPFVLGAINVGLE